MELDQEVFGAIAALDGAPWIIGGDLESIGGFIGVGEDQIETCVPAIGEHRILDFFILGPGFRETGKKIE
eukprot:6945090-Heterocapsa_arctica.AAC.1